MANLDSFKPPQEIRELNLLQELEKNPIISQRELSNKFGIALGVTNACLKRRTRDAARSLLDSVGLGSLGRRRPGQLSGGEQQRLAIARALAGRPSLLLLDEPFSSVDATTRSALYQLLEEISPQVPGPTIYVTHHVEDARRLAERVMRLDNGTLVASDGPWTEDS